MTDDDDLDRMPHRLQPRRDVQEHRSAFSLPVDPDEAEPEWNQAAVPGRRGRHGGFVDVRAGENDSNLLRRYAVGRLHVIGAPARHADDEAGSLVGLLFARQRLASDPPSSLRPYPSKYWLIVASM